MAWSEAPRGESGQAFVHDGPVAGAFPEHSRSIRLDRSADGLEAVVRVLVFGRLTRVVERVDDAAAGPGPTNARPRAALTVDAATDCGPATRLLIFSHKCRDLAGVAAETRHACGCQRRRTRHATC